MSKSFTLEKYQNIIDLLTNSEKTFSEIAKEIKSSPSYVKRINDGEVKLVRFAFQDTVFPIRESKKERNKKIINDLNEGMKVQDVAEKYKMTESNIRTIVYRTAKKVEGYSYEKV